MTLAFEPFKRLEFYHFNCKPNIDQYEKILDWQRKEGIFKLDDNEIETDYTFSMCVDFDDQMSNDIESQRLNLWSNYIDVCCGDKITEMLKEMKCEKFSILAAWSQITSGKSWHHPHHHGHNENNTKWSFVYYIDVCSDANHQGTIYLNPSDVEDSFIAEVKTGNMYLWPSNIIHMQPPSFNEKPRKIISGNVWIQ